MPKTNLRTCQVEAITALEKSFAADRPRALIQMATGAGKTFTACAFTYRLIKFAGARRVLFLVDRAICRSSWPNLMKRSLPKNWLEVERVVPNALGILVA